MMTFAHALAIAVTFWGARGVTVPLPLTPEYVPQTALPVTDVSGNTALMAYQNGRVMIGTEALALRKDYPGGYCMLIIHEAGHAAGLGHTTTGVMNPDLAISDRTEYPWPCRTTTPDNEWTPVDATTASTKMRMLR